MTLRPRALAITAAVSLTLAAILYYAAERSRVAAMQDAIAAFAETPAFIEVRTRCQNDPAKLGPVAADTSSFEVFAYDGEFRPADQDAPPFSTDLADRMRGKLSALGSYSSPDGSGVELGMATPWRTGHCALILVRLAPTPGEVLNEEIRIGVIVVIAAAAMWVTGGLIARRRRT